jgi:hypothetical protein
LRLSSVSCLILDEHARLVQRHWSPAKTDIVLCNS